MSDEEKAKIAGSLSPYFNHENLEWMNENYSDGNWKIKFVDMRMIRNT